MRFYFAGWVPVPALFSAKKPLTKCPQSAIINLAKNPKKEVVP